MEIASWTMGRMDEFIVKFWESVFHAIPEASGVKIASLSPIPKP